MFTACTCYGQGLRPDVDSNKTSIAGRSPCQLAVQEVAQIVEWAIGEYDGLETVVTK